MTAVFVVCHTAWAWPVALQDAGRQDGQQSKADPVEFSSDNQMNDFESSPANQPGSPSQASADGMAPDSDEEQPMLGVVIEVKGSVDWAPLGVSPITDEGWKPVVLGDQLGQGVQIRTSIRSHVNLRFGAHTYISIKSNTYMAVSDVFRSATTERITLELGYGTIRGASTEGEVRSDVMVHSVRATLAKRGTEGWEVFVEAGFGRFMMSLAQSGLVDAIRDYDSKRPVRREVGPGEYVTEGTIANLWLEQAVFDRVLLPYAPYGLSAGELEYSAFAAEGFGSLSPGGGIESLSLAQRNSPTYVLDQLTLRTLPNVAPPRLVIFEPGVLQRPEGNFGTGRGASIQGPLRRLAPAGK